MSVPSDPANFNMVANRMDGAGEHQSHAVSEGTPEEQHGVNTRATVESRKGMFQEGGMGDHSEEEYKRRRRMINSAPQYQGRWEDSGRSSKDMAHPMFKTPGDPTPEPRRGVRFPHGHGVSSSSVPQQRLSRDRKSVV